MSLVRLTTALTLVVAASLTACKGGGDTAGETGPSTTAPAVQWETAFDTSSAGALSGVWGSGPDDVFIFGGNDTQGEVHHFDGTSWSPMDVPAGVPLLAWGFGFGANDVYAVGIDGAAVHYDGSTWSVLDSGTDQDLWGVWGAAPNDMWVVGGDWGEGEPLILHWDGSAFTQVPLDPEENPRDATALFKVFGVDGKTFAVGETGTIVEWDGTAWHSLSGGAEANDDFVSLWGTSATNLVAVGGRSSAKIATYDGSTWETTSPSGTGGLNAVYTVDGQHYVIGGIYGYTATLDIESGEVTEDAVVTDIDIHAIWGDGAGKFYGVGGHFFAPYTGMAIVRTEAN
jgi:hypothetical protein